MKFFKKYRPLLIVLFVLFSLLPIISIFNIKNEYKKINAEDYQPDLISLNSTDKLINYVDSLFKIKSFKTSDTIAYINLLNETIENRFCYGLSNYYFSDNWIAVCASKLLWSHFASIVDPEDILKHPSGLCSQQTIVFLEVLRKKGIPFRTVGLGYSEGPGHFLSEVSYGGNWHVYDVTIEPNWEAIENQHKSMAYYLVNKDTFFVAYKDKLEEKNFKKIMEKVQYGNENQMPGKNMLMFHRVTKIITYVLPLLFLVLIIATIKK